LNQNPGVLKGLGTEMSGTLQDMEIFGAEKYF
jgi:hypothetical protein